MRTKQVGLTFTFIIFILHHLMITSLWAQDEKYPNVSSSQEVQKVKEDQEDQEVSSSPSPQNHASYNYYVSARGENLEISSDLLLHPRCQGSNFYQHFSQEDLCTQNSRKRPFALGMSKDNFNKILHFIEHGHYYFLNASDASNLKDVAQKCQLASFEKHIDEYLSLQIGGLEKELQQTFPEFKKLKFQNPSQYQAVLLSHALKQGNIKLVHEILDKKLIADFSLPFERLTKFGFEKDENSLSLLDYLIQEMAKKEMTPELALLQNKILSSLSLKGKNEYVVSALLKGQFDLSKALLKKGHSLHEEDKKRLESFVLKNENMAFLESLQKENLIDQEWVKWARKFKEEGGGKIVGLELVKTFVPCMGNDIHSFSLSRSGKILVRISDNRNVEISEIEGNKSVRTLPVANYVHGLAISPDDTLVAILTNDSMVSVTNIATGDKLFSLPSGTGYGLDFSPDGKYLAAAKNNGDVQIINMKNQNVERTIVGHGGSSSFDINFAPDSSLMAVASTFGTRVYSLPDFQVIATFPTAQSGHFSAQLHLHDKKKLLAINELHQSRIKLMDLNTGNQLAEFIENNNTYFASFDSLGQYLAISLLSGMMKIYEIESKKEVANVNLGSESTKVQFTLDRKHLVVSSRNDLRIYKILY